VSVLDPAPGDLANDGPVVVVADTLNHRLALYRLRDGSLLRHLGSKGAAPGQFQLPHSVAVTHADEMVVGDSGNRRVQVFAATGECLCVLDPSSVVDVGRLGNMLYGLAVC
jgi:DNA-binding beta-propeller fold protein YncE